MNEKARPPADYQKIAAMYRNGALIEDIESIMDCKRYTIYAALRAFEVPLRQTGPVGFHRDDEPTEHDAEDYGPETDLRIEDKLLQRLRKFHPDKEHTS